MGPVTNYGDCSPGSAASLRHRDVYQNNRRSQRAKDALDHYSEGDVMPIARIDELVNFLADLHHYCREYKMSLNDAYSHASHIFANEN